MSIYAVNGKVPISAWIPSLDTVGNGTTTLTDLVGSNNGTLTNMDPATDWVADTGAGGVRALDFDGENDHVPVADTSIIDTAGNWAISAWVMHRSNTAGKAIFSMTSAVSSTPVISIGQQNLATHLTAFIRTDSGFGEGFSSSTPFLLNVWTHYVLVKTGTVLNLYTNSVIDVNSFELTLALTVTRSTIGAWRRASLTSLSDQRIDDIRVFNQSLNASDVSYLWDSGNGRGRVLSTSTTHRRNNNLIGIL